MASEPHAQPGQPPSPRIGWRERIDLPEWGIRRLLAKADTGARHSAIHAENVEQLGGGRVRFEIVLSRRDQSRRRPAEGELVRIARVRSSNGQVQERPVVLTLVRIGPVEKRIEVSLVSRELMECRMLLGRSALQGSFVVDAGSTYLLTAPKPGRRRGSSAR